MIKIGRKSVPGIARRLEGNTTAGGAGKSGRVGYHS